MADQNEAPQDTRSNVEVVDDSMHIAISALDESIHEIRCARIALAKVGEDGDDFAIELATSIDSLEKILHRVKRGRERFMRTPPSAEEIALERADQKYHEMKEDGRIR